MAESNKEKTQHIGRIVFVVTGITTPAEVAAISDTIVTLGLQVEVFSESMLTEKGGGE